MLRDCHFRPPKEHFLLQLTCDKRPLSCLTRSHIQSPEQSLETGFTMLYVKFMLDNAFCGLMTFHRLLGAIYWADVGVYYLEYCIVHKQSMWMNYQQHRMQIAENMIACHLCQDEISLRCCRNASLAFPL